MTVEWGGGEREAEGRPVEGWVRFRRRVVGGCLGNGVRLDF